jgi:putative thiamine transport system substrate-binding protein
MIARLLALILIALTPAAVPLKAGAEPDPARWDAVLTEARGQTVYWHAWGGSPLVNAFIAWAGDTIRERHGVRVEHVKVADIAETVSRVLAEQLAGRTSGGAVDLMWINGENFAAMKANGLLFGPFATALPNWRWVDVAGKPQVTADFTVPTDGYESPWGMAQLVFYHDTARLPAPPRTVAALADWIRANPGRFAYPAPPDYLGSTFLKQVLHATIAEPAALSKPLDPSAAPALTAPLWTWLDGVHPALWRQARAWPQNESRLRQMMADAEIDLAFSFNPNEAASAIATGQLPDTVRAYVLDGGTIGNAHFVAIPFNARAKAGALVLADFLLSPEAQARAEDPAVWGSSTVLDLARLDPADRARFAAIPRGVAALTPDELAPSLPEPHPSWMVWIEQEWARRYATGR